MKKQETKWIAIIILQILILILGYCKTIKPNKINKVDDRKIENKIIEKTIINYKDSILYRDSVIIKYVSIRDTLRENNTNILERYKDVQTETKTSLELICDTLIEGLTTEIKILDTIIYNQNKTIEYRDTVIHNLEIINHNFEALLNDVEKELVKTDKKKRNNKIWALIMTGIAAITTTILIVK